MERVLIFAFGLVALGAAFHYDGSLNVASFLRLSSLNDQSWLEGKSRLLSFSENDNVCTGAFSCADCNTTMLCKPDGKGGYVPVRSSPCPESTPFCSYKTGTCTNEPEKSCGQQDDFVCEHEGHFPDADCKVYHVCSNKLSAAKFICEAPGELYNANEKKCEGSTKCGQFNCTNMSGKKVSHSEYPQYYGFCGDNISVIAIDRCPGKYQLNLLSQDCEPVCSQTGTIQDLYNCTRYFECNPKYEWNGVTHWKMESKVCPKETAYDPRRYICVSLEVHPDPQCIKWKPTPAPTPPTITTPGEPTPSPPTTTEPPTPPSTTTEPPSPT